MAVVTARSLVFLTAMIAALSGCEEGQFLAPSSTDGDEITDETTVVPEARVEIQEIDRPDIFSTQEMALWDGRPSLGGIWVAHPDADSPERVRIENTSSGQTITGALFRRERANPGPRIQLSSDAAAALDVLAGQPTELSIVVIRQEEVVIEAAPLPVDETAEAAVAETTEDGSSNTTTAVVAGTAAAAAASPPERPGFWQRFRQSLRNEPETAGANTPEVAPATAADASVPEVEIEPLDPLAAAAAAIDEVEENTESSAQPAPESVSTAPVVPTGLKNPFVQVGLFSVEANATAAAANLRQGGIVPTIAEGANDDRRFWRVIVGPMTSATDQAEVLGQVRALGYSDAFLTPN
ncbi:MAG: SPOR domain-containing protein [Boseongicola sp.]